MTRARGVALEARAIDLRTARPFTISAGTTTTFRNVIAILEVDAADVAAGAPSARDAHTRFGYGEAAPSRRVTGETIESVMEVLAWAAKELDAEPDLEGFLARVHERVPGSPSARCALDLAVHDALAKRQGVPVHELLGIPRGRVPSGMTVSLASPEAMAEEARTYAARGVKVLKLKLGDAAQDAERARAVRDAAPNLAMTADANQGWSGKDAESLLVDLAGLGFDLVEQPVAVSEEAELVRLSRQSPVPVYADETCRDAADVARLLAKGFRGGVNLKLQKTGGLAPAVEAARLAREAGLGVMVGCNLETGVGISAAGHLLGWLEHADLDGNLLLAEDPFAGYRGEGAWLETPRGAGLGVRPAQSFA